MATAARPRQPRLRASCDGCFLAKVKCSKARPICSRCLACGIECRYSPSSRAGKPKADMSPSHTSSVPANLTVTIPHPDDGNMIYTPQQAMPALYKIEPGWNTPPASLDGAMSRSHSFSSGMTLLGMDTSPTQPPDPAAVVDMYGPGIPWTPPNDISSQLSESPILTGPMSHSHTRSQSYDVAMSGSMAGWVEHAGPDAFAFGPTQPSASGGMPPQFFPSPSTTPHLQPVSRIKPSTMGSAGSNGSCTCFTACLQSLQALHNASSPGPPPFDLVLSLNRKAVEGCASMLACPRCMSRSGTHTAAMLLATVIGKISSFYRSASHSHFMDGAVFNSAAMSGAPGLGVSFGAYQVNGEDGKWLELEILTRELRKLEEVYLRFREVCADLSEDAEVSKAMLGYLGQNLGSTLEVLNHQRTDVVYT